MPDELNMPGIAVIAASGGMDSTALLVHLLARDVAVHAIGFDYGQKHRIELSRLEANIEYLRAQGIDRVGFHRADLTSVGGLLDSALTDSEKPMPLGHYEQASMKQTFVPNRNAIFASITYGHALSIAKREQADVAWGLGVHSGDHAIYPDCRPEFFRQLFSAFQSGNWDSERVRLYLPYLNLDKAQILRDAQQSIQHLKLDFETVFRNTCTSYLPDAFGRAHGMTGSDVERILAFHQLGLRDPIEYGCSWEAVVQTALEIESQFRSQGGAT